MNEIELGKAPGLPVFPVEWYCGIIMAGLDKRWYGGIIMAGLETIERRFRYESSTGGLAWCMYCPSVQSKGDKNDSCN